MTSVESVTQPLTEGDVSPSRTEIYSTRVIRNSQIGNEIKELYKCTCQFSGVQLITPLGPYAEACHIRPVGKPHSGPDISGNVLCLCPNMHVLFDHGAISLSDDLQVIGLEVGKIALDLKHELDLDCIRYHREHIYKPEQIE